MITALVALSFASVAAALAFFVLSAIAGAPDLLPRALAAMLVVDQATLTFLAFRIPALARLRPLVRVGALFAILGGVAGIVWSAEGELGTMRWLAAAVGAILIAQGAVTMAALARSGSHRASNE